MQVSKFMSRKFSITVLGMVGTFILAGFGKMSPDVAGVVAIGIGAYNITNGYISGKYADIDKGKEDV